ncbi:MAG: hypothetical protein JXR03_07025 [Cyclobacteriaceae bacterium]
MKESEHNKMGLNQLEEQVSNTLRAVDKLTADMQDLREYTIENNKVVNSILHKLDEHSEQFEKNDKRLDRILSEMDADRKLRDAQFNFLLQKVEK